MFRIGILVECLAVVSYVLGNDQNHQSNKPVSDTTSQEKLNGIKTTNKAVQNDFASLIEALHHVQNVQKQMDEFSECKENESIVLNIAFDHSRWKSESMLVLEVANLMTLLWSETKSIVENDTFLYSVVRSNVLFSKSVYGSVICFERGQYKNYTMFCPYAYRDKKLDNNIHVLDISVQHDYLTSFDTIWWRLPREKALKMNLTHLTDHYNTRFNASAENPMRNLTVPVLLNLDDGLWTHPYFDCFGGKSWMVTYLAPFFNETNQFLGVVSIDIQLNDIDINQCGSAAKNREGTGDKTGGPQDYQKLNDFMGTHRCKKSTKCVNIPNQGFKRGSYWCECAQGYYYPPSNRGTRYNGSVIEAEYDKKDQGLPNSYEKGFECRKCSDGCLECVDSKPCQYSFSIVTRILLLIINGLAVLMVFGFGRLVIVHRDAKVFNASSPLFLLFILFGAILMYIGFIFQYLSPQQYIFICVLFPWLKHLGFVLAYGSLSLKLWRVNRTFRVRSPHKVEITDRNLLRHLAIIVAVYVTVLLVWTLTTKSFVSNAVTVADLKYYRCSTNWFDYAIVVCNVALLLYALWLCYRVRKAPSTYNENRFITWAIYNAMFVVCFFAILRSLTWKNTNPDIIYAIEFVFIHMIATVMILLVFIPKCIIIRKIKLRGVNTSFSSSKKRSGELSPNGTHLYVTDMAVMERENEDLKAEVKRLSAKVAYLQSRMMKDRNKHIKTSGITTWRRERSTTKDTEDGDPVDMPKISPSPISRFLSSHV